MQLLSQLARRRVEVGRVTVEGLQINLRMDGSGTENWSDLLERLSEEAAKTRAQRPSTAAAPS